jgi:hypothetical protein
LCGREDYREAERAGRLHSDQQRHSGRDRKNQKSKENRYNVLIVIERPKQFYQEIRIYLKMDLDLICNFIIIKETYEF